MEDSLSFINNRFQPYNTARLHVSDLTLHRGYGIFDYFLEIDGHIPFFDDYIDRFFTSAALMHLEIPMDRNLLKEKIHYLTKENHFRYSGIRMILTGGYTEDFITPGQPNLVILNFPFQIDHQRLGKGVKLITHEYIRYLPEIKTINYIPSVLLLPEMKEKNALEPLFHLAGHITETSRSNFFIVQSGKVITPGKQILRGVIRKQLLTMMGKGIEWEERDVLLKDLADCDEAFITGTTKHLAPVVAIDDIQIGDGQPGKLTLALRKEFERWAGAH